MTSENWESGAEASHEEMDKPALGKERRPVGTGVPTRGAMCNKALYFPKQ
jgi:hypothetical protein